jgi:hypothetical protein
LILVGLFCFCIARGDARCEPCSLRPRAAYGLFRGGRWQARLQLGPCELVIHKYFTGRLSARSNSTALYCFQPTKPPRTGYSIRKNETSHANCELGFRNRTGSCVALPEVGFGWLLEVPSTSRARAAWLASNHATKDSTLPSIGGTVPSTAPCAYGGAHCYLQLRYSYITRAIP